MMSLSAKVPKPLRSEDFPVSQDSCLSVEAKLEPAVPGPEFHLQPEAPRLCIYQRTEGGALRPKESIPETPWRWSRPSSSMVIPDTS